MGGNEGCSDDTKCHIQICCRDDWPEDEGCEGRSLGNDGCCVEGVEEVRLFQVGRQAELEVEEEGRNASTEGREPFHQGAMRFQGQACIEDCEGLRHEEAQGSHQLREALRRVMCTPC